MHFTGKFTQYQVAPYAGAWVEIWPFRCCRLLFSVAPPRGGVSRNRSSLVPRLSSSGRPPRGGEQKHRRWKGRETISPPSFLQKIFTRGSLLTRDPRASFWPNDYWAPTTFRLLSMLQPFISRTASTPRRRRRTQAPPLPAGSNLPSYRLCLADHRLFLRSTYNAEHYLCSVPQRCLLQAG